MFKKIRNIPILLFGVDEDYPLVKNSGNTWSTNNCDDVIEFLTYKPSIENKYSHKFTSKISTSDNNTPRFIRGASSGSGKGEIIQKMHYKEEINSINSNPIHFPFSYYEVSVKSSNPDAQFIASIGLSDTRTINRELENEHVGQWKSSFGYTNSGDCYENGSKVPIFVLSKHFQYIDNHLKNSQFHLNDIIGCGFNYLTNEIFWTKNGEYLFAIKSNQLNEIPTVLQGIVTISSTDKIKIFGYFEKSFLFNPLLLYDIYFNTNYKLHVKEKQLFKQSIINIENICRYLPIFANIAQYSSLFQLILRSYLFLYQSTFKTLNLARYYHEEIIFQQKQNLVQHHSNKLIVDDFAMSGIGKLFPPDFPIWENVNLDHCKFTSPTIFSNIPNFYQIRRINLQQLTLNDAKAISSITETCNRIVYFAAWQNISPSFILKITNSLKYLQTLNLAKCNISCKDFSNCVKKISKLPNLTALIIDECVDLTDESLNQITAHLSGKLEKFSMERCNFKESSVIDFIDRCKKIHSLGLGGWGNESMVTDNVLSAITKRIQRNEIQLTGISLYSATISDDKFLEFLQRNQYLEDLNIGKTALSNNSLSQIKNLDQLHYLDLVNSKINDSSLLKIVQSCYIIQLSLQSCSVLTPAGITEAVKCLTGTCEYLCLKSTNVDISIVPVIKEMEKLAQLDIRDTKSLCSLENHIDFGNNNINVITLPYTANLDESNHIMWTTPNTRVVTMHRRKTSH